MNCAQEYVTSFEPVSLSTVRQHYVIGHTPPLVPKNPYSSLFYVSRNHLVSRVTSRMLATMTIEPTHTSMEAVLVGTAAHAVERLGPIPEAGRLLT